MEARRKEIELRQKEVDVSRERWDEEKKGRYFLIKEAKVQIDLIVTFSRKLQ